jgi:hypothetical protein
MSQPDDESQEALKRLQDRLDTFDGQRAPKAQSSDTAERSMGEGYRLLGEVIGGVLGGPVRRVVDHFAHTTLRHGDRPVAGTAAPAYAAMKTAERMSRDAAKKGD